MRRFLKKVLRRPRRAAIEQQAVAPDPAGELQIFLPDAPPGGYHCWDNTKCPLCSCFLDRYFVLKLLVTKFVSIGTIADLLLWTQGRGQDSGCSLCSYVCLRFMVDSQNLDPIPFDASLVVRINTRNTAVRGGRKDEVLGLEFDTSWGFPRMKSRHVRTTLFAKSDENIARYITVRPPNGRVNSPEAFQQAQSWIEDCDSQHIQCKSILPPKLPTRVLEVSKTDDGGISVRLHETAGDEQAPYIALSYVWGKPQTVRTLQGNIEERRKNIEFSTLPKTIADAVYCTTQLGLRYLWVDSLCIIQDSQEDKEREIGKMSSIYRDSHVTISAAMTTNCDQGFLEDRETTVDYWKMSFHIPILAPMDHNLLLEWIEKYRREYNHSVDFDFPASEDGDFVHSPWAQSDAWHPHPSVISLCGHPFQGEDREPLSAPEEDDEPINKRGWTLQESWLPRRQLIYGSGQVLWKCKTHLYCDGGVQEGRHQFDNKVPYFIDGKGDVFDGLGEKLSESGRGLHLRRTWRDLVSEFSRRELTVPGDKLNAVQGIAQDLQLRSGYDFLAGLWKQDLVSELAWYQDMTKTGAKSILWNRKRTCPSWSWISVDGPIRHSHAENSNVTIEDAEITSNKNVGTHPNLRLVVEGKITLRAPMSTLTMMDLHPHFKFLDENCSRQQFSNTIYVDGGFTNPCFQTDTTDGQPTVIVPSDIRFLELSWGKRDGSQNIAAESRGLVLVPVEGQEKTYRRVGFFVVALEYDVDWAMGSDNLLMMLSIEPGNVRPTEFGELWKAQLEEETVMIV